MQQSTFTRFALAAALGLVAGAGMGIAAPAAAKKPRPVVIAANVFKDDSTKLCMPSPADRHARTLCQTRAEWEAQGVTFRVK